MKKFFILFFAILSQFTAIAQDSVLGIKFGTDKNEVKNTLENRFGEYSVHELNGNLTVYNCMFAGIEFKSMDFEFAWNNGISYFNSAFSKRGFHLQMLRLQKKVEILYLKK